MIIIDSSAIIAILFGEAETAAIAERLAADPERPLEPPHGEPVGDRPAGVVGDDPETELPEIFYIGRAHQVETDRQGRILIPAKLRDFAHIERDVTFSAQIDYLQLWSRATLERLDAVANKLADEDPKFMAKLR